jgi:uncharacterized repeat protein (TIGR03843 family)
VRDVFVTTDICERLKTEGFRVEGRMPWSSNATFLVTVGPSVTSHDHVEPDDPVEPPDSERDEYVDEFDDDEFDDELQAEDDDGSDDDDDDDDDGDEGDGTSGLPSLPDGAVRGIYKPHRGERPLWDFPSGLYRREVAAYELSQWLGWSVVPPTVLREADYGLGSVQLFIEADFAKHYFNFLEEERFHLQLKTMAAFDVVANNADRKGGHVLIDADDHLWGIDNGLCFNVEPKLRTVIWDFAGETLPTNLTPDLDRLAGASIDDLGSLPGLLLPDELDAMRTRAGRLVERNELPTPRSDHAYPWPLV